MHRRSGIRWKKPASNLNAKAGLPTVISNSRVASAIDAKPTSDRPCPQNIAVARTIGPRKGAAHPQPRSWGSVTNCRGEAKTFRVGPRHIPIRHSDVLGYGEWSRSAALNLSPNTCARAWRRHSRSIARGLVSPVSQGGACGDAQRGQEISTELMVSPRSLIWKQAANKLYGGAAVLQYVIGG